MSSAPVFIVGMPRSGTTLLSNLLNATEQIYFPGETHFFLLEDKMGFKNEKDFQLFYTDYNKNPYLGALGLSDQFINELRDNVFGNGDFLEKICLSKANDQGVKRWGEKTPSHFMYVNQIYRYFPNAILLNIYRDPRDVINSIINANWGRIKMLKWLKGYKKNVQFIKSISSNKCLHIRYEDLTNTTMAELSKISNFIHVSIDSDILNTFYLPKNLNFALESEPWKKNNLSPISNINAFKWKKSKTNKVIMRNKFISWYLKDEIKFLNYDKYCFPNPIYSFIIWNKYFFIYWLENTVKYIVNYVRQQ
ncbi:sulfotransferase family protein [Ulvibacterium sp.]|uniref:sulfotransferase family protein n=1 Tax=Ulvibacterium sp. TaxID=2665914 RepID=UPI003BACF2D8